MRYTAKKYSKQFSALKLIFGAIFVFLIASAIRIQLTNNAKYLYEANLNTIKYRKLPAPRGTIYDRNHKVLAFNNYLYDAYVIPFYFSGDINFICDTLDINNCDRLSANMKAHNKNRLLLAKNISAYQIDLLNNFKGIFISSYPVRTYVNNISAHAVGYLGRVGRDVLENDNADEFYADDDFTGASGIEKVYDRDLHGINGKEQYVVRANGLELLSPNKFIKNNIIKPVAGKDVVLTIDEDIQEEISDAFGDNLGSATMINLDTGEVIALISKGSFDTNAIRKAIIDKNKPLIDRVMSVSAPGSTFKLIVALCALESGAVKLTDMFDCPGYYSFGGRVYKCWKKGGHHKVNLVEAIQHSCDVAFFMIAQKVGINNIKKYAEKLGLNNLTGIDLDGEIKGTIPDIAWFKKNLGYYTPGSTLSVGIGQSAVQVSTLQMSVAYATIANGGKMIKPHLIKNVNNNEIEINELITNNNFDQKNIDILNRAMYSVINVEGGTAYASRSDKVEISGKTGTSQNAALSQKNIKDDSWFCGLSLKKINKVVICIHIEKGGHGTVAAAMAKRILEKYYEKNN